MDSIHLALLLKKFKVDISRAFRHIKIDPGGIDLLGLCHKCNDYLNPNLHFGFRLGSPSNTIRFIMCQNRHEHLQNYIDLLYCDLPSAKFFLSLSASLATRSGPHHW